MKQYTLGSMIRASAWGAIFGGATGFALGIMLAPEQGQKIRRRLVYQLEHLAEQASALVDQMISPEDLNEARRSGHAVVEDARNRAEAIQNDIDALLVEMRRGTPAKPPSENE